MIPAMFEEPIFLLGTERSGTTWLANIFDTSPETLLFMEPFAPDYHIFPEFPDATYFLEHSSPFLQGLLKDKLPERLLKYKHLLNDSSLTAPRWFQLERSIVSSTKRLSRFMPFILRERFRKFELLNLNRFESAFPVPLKHNNPPVWVIKELRLAGKIPILLDAFPNASFVVIIRHPAATIHSMLNWFQKGRLGELRQDMHTFLERIEVQNVADSYRDLIDKARQGDLVCRLALYWRMSYEVMCGQLHDLPRAHILPYEKLSVEPLSTTKEIFSQVGLEWSQALEEYVLHSTSESAGKGSSVINTVRDSRTYYQSWTQTISDTTFQTVMSMVGDSVLMELFQPHYDAQFQTLG